MEEVVPFVGLGLLHGLGQLVLLDVFVSVEIDVLDPYPGALVYSVVDPDGVLDDCVFLGFYLDVSVQESFLREIALDDVSGCLGHVIGEFSSPPEVEPFLEVSLLRLADSAECPAGNPGPFLEDNLQIDGIPVGTEAVNLEGDVLEVSLEIEAVNHGVEVVTWDAHLHALAQACLLDDLLGAEIMVSFYGYVSQDEFPGVIIVYLKACLLGRRKKRQCQRHDREYEFR